MAFLFVFFFWDSYDSNVGAFDIVPEAFDVFLISFNSFIFFSSLLHLFPPFYLPPHISSPSVILLLIPSRMFLISVSALFIPDKAMAPHSGTLAWRIPWTEDPGRLQSMGSLRVGYD